jgi:hypothetical protein
VHIGAWCIVGIVAVRRLVSAKRHQAIKKLASWVKTWQSGDKKGKLIASSALGLEMSEII